MKKLANHIITEVKQYILDYELSEGVKDIEHENVMVTLKFNGSIIELHDKFREGHENRNFKVIVYSIHIVEFLDDEELNEEKRTELNNLLNEML
jgi:hypothetical protein